MIASLVSSNFPEIKHPNLWCCFYFIFILFIYFYLFFFIYLFLQSRFHDNISLPTTLFINWNCLVCRHRIFFLVSSIYNSTSIRDYMIRMPKKNYIFKYLDGNICEWSPAFLRKYNISDNNT